MRILMESWQHCMTFFLVKNVRNRVVLNFSRIGVLLKTINVLNFYINIDFESHLLLFCFLFFTS